MFDKFKEEVKPDVFHGLNNLSAYYSNGTEQKILYPELMETSDYSGIFFTNKFVSLDSFSEKARYFSKNAIFKSHISNPCNFFIPQDISNGAEVECKRNNPPVPDLENEFLDYGQRKNLSGFSYYVLNNKAGWYLKKSNDNRKTTNGFSNGVVINEVDKEIIYWIIIW